MESIYADGEAVFEAKSAFLCTASAAEVGEDHLRGGVRAHKVCQGQSRSSLAREGGLGREGMRHVMQETCPLIRPTDLVDRHEIQLCRKLIRVRGDGPQRQIEFKLRSGVSRSVSGTFTVLSLIS